MRSKRFLLLLSFTIFIIQQTYSQKDIRTNSTSDTITLQGILTKKQWSKSKQSFCAQGFEYYTLTTEKEEILLDANEDSSKLLDEYLNRKVVISGFIVQKIIPQNEMLQHPISETTCTIFHFLKFN